MAKSKVVDVDSHVLEPWDLWERRLEPEYWDRALRLKKDERGLEYLEIDRKKPKSHFLQGGLLGRDSSLGENLKRAMTPGLVTYEEALRARPASYDPHERIKVLDGEGIDVSILYPTLGLSWETECDDPKLSAAYARVYNDWIIEFCAEYPHRFVPIAHIPTRDVGESVKELKRAIQRGAKGIMVLSQPSGGRSYGDEYYDPLWAEVQDMDIPVGLHVWGNPNYVGSGMYPGQAGPEMAWFIFAMLAVDEIVGFTSLFNGGVFDRFPELRIVVLETGGGWIPYWMERLDSLYDVYGFTTPMKQRPSESFQRHCWLSLDPDTKLAVDTIRFVGVDRCMWAGDFPHSDASLGVVSEVKEAIGALPEEDQIKILGENAARLYHLT